MYVFVLGLMVFSYPDEEIEKCDLIDMINSNLISWMEQKTNAHIERPIDGDILQSLAWYLNHVINKARSTQLCVP